MKHRRSCTPLNKRDPLCQKWNKRGMAKTNYRHLGHRHRIKLVIEFIAQQETE